MLHNSAGKSGAAACSTLLALLGRLTFKHGNPEEFRIQCSDLQLCTEIVGDGEKALAALAEQIGSLNPKPYKP